MSSDLPRCSARCPLSTLLLLFISLLSLHTAAQPNTTMEVDLITPLANGTYRVNPSRGLAVLVAIQNRHLGDPAAWRFEWSAMRLSPSRPRFYVAGAVTSTGTNIWGSPTHALNHTPSDSFLALSHPRIEPITDKPMSYPTPPGEYEFTWNVQIGPWCEVLAVPRSREFGSTHHISRGKFKFTVVEDGPWPVVAKAAGGECASVAGQVSFAAYNTIVPAWDTRYDEDMGPCAMTASVTEKAAPCRATVDVEQAARVSSIMTWVDGPTGTPSLGVRLGGRGGWGVLVSFLVLVC